MAKKATSTSAVASEINLTEAEYKNVAEKFNVSGFVATVRTSAKSNVKRYRCICGEHGSGSNLPDAGNWGYKKCPKCGGILRCVEQYYGHPSIQRIVFGPDKISGVNYQLEVSLSADDKTIIYTRKDDVVFVYDMTKNKVMKTKATYYWERYPEQDVEEMKKVLGADFSAMMEQSSYSSPADVLLVMSELPKVFTAENCKQYPGVIEDLHARVLQLMENTRKASGLYTLTFPNCHGSPVKVNKNFDIQDVCEAIGIPWEYVSKENRFGQAAWLIPVNEFEDFAHTDLGMRIIAKHQHGSIDVITLMELAMLTNYLEHNPRALALSSRYVIENNRAYAVTTHWRTVGETVAVSKGDRDCWAAFLRDALDQYTDTEQLWGEFVNRIKVLKEKAVLVTDDSIRTRQFNAINNADGGPFRIVDPKADFTLVDNDPLALLEACRFNEKYHQR